MCQHICYCTKILLFLTVMLRTNSIVLLEMNWPNWKSDVARLPSVEKTRKKFRLDQPGENNIRRRVANSKFDLVLIALSQRSFDRFFYHHRYIKFLLSFPCPIYSQANPFILQIQRFDLKNQFVKWLLQNIPFR